MESATNRNWHFYEKKAFHNPEHKKFENIRKEPLFFYTNRFRLSNEL